MRVLIDVGENRLRALDALAREREQSRAALIREAVDDFLSRHRRVQAAEAFVPWRAEGRDQPGEDGVAYQERLRAEW